MGISYIEVPWQLSIGMLWARFLVDEGRLAGARE